MMLKKICKNFDFRNLCLAFVFLIGKAAFSQSGEDLVRKMHAKYFGRWYRTFTFVQTTEIYRNDSLIKTSTWYEAAIFRTSFVLTWVIRRMVMRSYISKIPPTAFKITI